MQKYSYLFLGLMVLMLPGCIATAIVGGTTVAGSSIHDERSFVQHMDDSAVATKIDSRLLLEKDMPSRWISVEVINGTAILTGYLPSQQHIDRAIHIVKLIRGVKDVRSELLIGEPAFAGVFSDTWITSRVKTALWNDKEVSGFTIHVETVNGRVYLQGVVKLAEHRQKAMQLAKADDGVNAVVDLMQSSQP
ncbi:MAG: BON domain-containing protein [Mariprofundaceae bacterium]